MHVLYIDVKAVFLYILIFRTSRWEGNFECSWGLEMIALGMRRDQWGLFLSGGC